ncbi:MAG: alpha-ketoglutarate-dependent dioxygenase AlkB, partial [Actinomycetota bacterium]
MLFASNDVTTITDGAVLLHGAAQPDAECLMSAIMSVVNAAPLRTVMTPMGKPMSVEMTNCGEAGWVADRTGYRYEPCDPMAGQPWPPMPTQFADLAHRMGQRAGYPNFEPDVCL